MTQINQTTRGPSAQKLHPAKVATTKNKYKDNIEILGVGQSLEDERFLQVAVGDKTALLNVDNLSDPRSGELKKLTPLGEPLIKPAARTDFLNRAHDVARAEPTFKVAVQTGWFDGTFILPEGLAGVGEPNVARYFDPRYAVYHRRLHRSGTVAGWLDLARSCRGKSRLFTGLCLALSGVVCGAFGDEPPGVQVVSSGGRGGTTIGRVVGTVWGGDSNPARKIGCGVSCNNSGINFEVLGGAFDQMLLFLDDMHNAGEVELKALLNLMNGEGRGRSDRAGRVDFCTPTLCTANVSWVHVARELKRPYLIYPLVDRIMEFGRPAGWPYLFEGIRTKEEFRVYGNQLRRLARIHFGWAGPEFARRLERWMQADLPAVQAFVAACHEAYHVAAENIASSCGRDVGRVSNRFATLYVAGCLAIRFKVFPFTAAEVLEALLTCHRDHVAFIDQQLNIPAGKTPAITPRPTAMTAQEPVVGAGTPDRSPLAKLKHYLDANIPDGLIDLCDPATELPVDHDHDHSPGYLGIHDKKVELWFSNARLEKITGGKHEGRALKQALAGIHVLRVWGRGHGKVSPTVKRRLANLGLHWVVAIRPSLAMKARWPALRNCERQPPPPRPEIRRSPFPSESHRLHCHIGKAQRALSPRIEVEVPANRRRQLPRRHAQGSATRTPPHRD
jgi:hypothetical protein